MFLCCFRGTIGPPPGSSKPVHEETQARSHATSKEEVSAKLSSTIEDGAFPFMILQIDAQQRCKTISSVTFSEGEQIYSNSPAIRPRIVCLLLPEGSITAPICLPHPTGTRAEAKFSTWFRAKVVFADDSARAAWASRDLLDMSNKLATYCKRDPTLAQTLSQAAASVTNAPHLRSLPRKQHPYNYKSEILTFPGEMTTFLQMRHSLALQVHDRHCFPRLRQKSL
jgi:hypothetical protein